MLHVYAGLPFLNMIAVNISNDQPFACSVVMSRCGAAQSQRTSVVCMMLIYD